jgi:hypothetical protein
MTERRVMIGALADAFVAAMKDMKSYPKYVSKLWRDIEAERVNQ